MKNLFYIILALGTILAFTACGSDDEYETLSFNATIKKDVTLRGFQGQRVTEPAVTESLENMLKESATGYDGTRIASANLTITGDTYIRITGLNPGMTLRDFTLKINGLERNFGNITSETVNLHNDVNLNYFSSAFAKIVSDHRLSLEVSYTPSADIAESDNIKVELSYDGRFHYNKRI